MRPAWCGPIPLFDGHPGLGPAPDELEALALEAPPSRDAHGDAALLAMMFVCCHPALPLESALALRTLCGFPIPALRRALHTDEVALEKRLARARQTLRDGSRRSRDDVTSPAGLMEKHPGGRALAAGSVVRVSATTAASRRARRAGPS